MGYWVGGMVQGQGSIDLREILGHFGVISKMGFSGLGPESSRKGFAWILLYLVRGMVSSWVWKPYSRRFRYSSAISLKN